MYHLRMHPVPETKPTSKTFGIYLAVFFLSFHYFFIVYINSNFLAQYFTDSWIGSLYIIGSVINIAILMCVHKLLRKMGNIKLLASFIGLEILSILFLAFSSSPWLLCIAFIGQHVLNPMILYCFDIILDTYSERHTQGRSRGTFLTILNTPPIIATLITGFILHDHNFKDIYLISLAFIIPLIFMVFTQFKTFVDPQYKQIGIKKVFSRLKSHRLVRDIFIDNIVLQVFYAIMTIYLPLYLVRNIGFNLSEIAFIFSIMLIPFVALELPVGKIADEDLGEKEFIVSGFILMGISISLIAWISSTSLWVWVALLVASRIGAAVVEITTESYFFKHVNPSDADMIGVFRMSHAVAFAVTPLIGAIALKYVDIQNMFIIGASIILIVGLRYAFDLKDTR